MSWTKEDKTFFNMLSAVLWAGACIIAVLIPSFILYFFIVWGLGLFLYSLSIFIEVNHE